MAALLVLSLAACGQGSGGAATEGQGRSDAPLEREDNSIKQSESAQSKTDEAQKNSEDAGGNGSGTDISSISDIQGATDVVWGKQDDISRAEIIAAAEAEGMEVTFGDDGSMTIVDADGSIFIQNPDGSWTQKDEDGTVSQLGSSWPSNEFTKLIPDPGFAVLGLSASDDEFTAAFQGVSVDDIMAYADKVKTKGFTINAEEQDQEVYGITVYTYEAYNEDGYRVSVFFTSGTSGVTVSK